MVEKSYCVERRGFLYMAISKFMPSGKETKEGCIPWCACVNALVRMRACVCIRLWCAGEDGQTNKQTKERFYDRMWGKGVFFLPFLYSDFAWLLLRWASLSFLKR